MFFSLLHLASVLQKSYLSSCFSYHLYHEAKFASMAYLLDSNQKSLTVLQQLGLCQELTLLSRQNILSNCLIFLMLPWSSYTHNLEASATLDSSFSFASLIQWVNKSSVFILQNIKCLYLSLPLPLLKVKFYHCAKQLLSLSHAF